MIPSILSGVLFLAYVAIIIVVIWQVITALNRISKGVEDMAATLRRMESTGKPHDPSI